jgi:transposase
VEQAEGSADAKRRLRVILETVAGLKSVPEACAALGVEEARFYQLREKAMEAAVAGLEAGASGRPRKEEPAESAEVKALREERDRLRLELRLSQVREELAVALPHVLKRGKAEPPPDVKKTTGRTPQPPPIITNPPSCFPDGSKG